MKYPPQAIIGGEAAIADRHPPLAAARRSDGYQYQLNTLTISDGFHVKIEPEAYVLQPYGRTSVFSTALWAAPLLEGPSGHLEVVVQPEAAQKRIHHNPSLVIALSNSVGFL